MKKVAILTLYGYANFGNRYQNYAVQETVKKYGYEVETIAVYPNRKQFIRPYFYRLKAASGDISAKRYLKIYSFSKKYIPVRMVVSADYRLPDSIAGEYDYFVTGSDQVWNPHIRQKERQNFFLSFADRSQRICISPSFGITEIPEEYREAYIEGLNGFNHLCSREQAGVDIIKALTGRDAELLIDPTLALTKEEWSRLFSHKYETGKSYFVIAMLGKLSEEKRSYINELAAKNNSEIIDIFDSKHIFGPDEILALIDNASLVFTDSFHFTAFSINFNTPFIVAEREENSINSDMFSRLVSLLGMFSLEDRQYGKTAQGKELECDFGFANEELERQREKYFSFAERSLNYENKG